MVFLLEKVIALEKKENPCFIFSDNNNVTITKHSSLLPDNNVAAPFRVGHRIVLVHG